MAGFFNTSWDLGNMFASPFSGEGFTYDESGMPLMDSGITPRPGNEGPGMMPTNTWGAPTGYDPSQQQQGNMFNPYSAGGNNFYNPYSFGQTTTGTQYGGGQQPWWMNYNMGNSVVNPPNIPQQPVQPQAQAQAPRRPQGTGPNGKDLTYDETIKYFGLYDGAENAFAAGDKQAAYRQDHMQWRSGTGAWEGKGKQEGQSDLDYPGRTTDAGDVIMGDRQKLLGLSGMFGNIPDNLKAYFSGSQDNKTLDATAAIGGGSGFTQVPMTAGPFDYLQRGRNKYTASDVQAALDAGLLDPNRVEVEYTNPIDPMLRPGNNLPFGENTNIFGPAAPVPNFLRQGNMNPFNIPYGPQNGGADQTYVAQDDNRIFDIADIPGAGIKLSNMGGGLRTNQYSANDKDNIFIQNLIKNGTLSAADAPMAQINPYGMTDDGMTRPATEQEYASNVLNNNYPRNMFLQDYQKSLEDTGAARIAAEKAAAEQAQADAFIAAQNERNREAAQAAAAEKERQAAAAQARMNDRYETGPVPKNIFTSGTGGSSSGRGRPAPKAPAAPKKETTTRRYTGRYGL